MGRVSGRVALVVGAGGGIGGAGAEALAREGASVFCTDSDSAAAEALGTTMASTSNRCYDERLQRQQIETEQPVEQPHPGKQRC